MRFLCTTLLLLLLIACAVLAPSAVWAGPYTDDLAKCLVGKTSKEDRNLLVQWMFAATASHPAVVSLVKVSDRQIDQLNREAAGLFVDLLTVSCRDKAQQALKYEGKNSIEASFQVLGQVAGRELFSDPSVAKNMAGMQQYLDEQKLKALVEPEE